MKTSGNKSETCNVISSTSNTTYMFLYGKFNGIPDTLIINVVVFVCLLLLFTILRKIAWDYGRLALVNRTEESYRIRNARPTYNVWTSLFFGDRSRQSRRVSQEDSLDTNMTSQDKGLFRWVITFWKLRDVDILNKCGKDAIQYLSFQRHLLVYLAIITVLSIGVILPLNFQGDLLGTAVEFGRTTIGNLDEQSLLLVVHAFMAIVYLVIVIALLQHFRLNLNVLENEQVTRTLMISNIPKNKCFHSPILQHFQEAYPEATVTDIQFAYDIADLVRLDKKRQTALDALRFCDLKHQKTGKRLMMRPVVCGQVCCCCSQVDAIHFYKDEEAKLKKICDEKKVTAYQMPLGICFVTLGSLEQAQRIQTDFRSNCKGTHNPQMSSLYQELQVHNWQMQFAPSPENIYWENLSIPDWRWWTNALCINSILVVVLFFITTPIMFLHTLDMLKIDVKKPVEEHLHSPFLVQFLPTLLLWIVSALLPNLVYWSDHFIGHWTKTAEHHAVMRKTFIFLLLMVLILPSLGLTSAQGLFDWIIVEKSHKVRWGCIFLPGNGAFFINYIITSAFIGTALELLRFPELLVYCLKLLLSRSLAERSAVRKAVLWDFQYGIQYAWILCMTSIIVSFSIPCPLITPFGLLYLSFKHITDRYNIFYAYRPSRINMHIHSSAVTFVIWAVIMLQINVVFFTGLRSEGFNPVFIFSSVALFITLLIFVGHISFGWFKHVKLTPYRNIHEGDEDGDETTSSSSEVISKPFVANILSGDLSCDLETNNPTWQTDYGATQDADQNEAGQELPPNNQIT